MLVALLKIMEICRKFSRWLQIWQIWMPTLSTTGGNISAQPHTIVKQIFFPKGNVLFLSSFSLSKNWMHNVVWDCAEILPYWLSKFVQEVANNEGKVYPTRTLYGIICGIRRNLEETVRSEEQRSNYWILFISIMVKCLACVVVNIGRFVWITFL